MPIISLDALKRMHDAHGKDYEHLCDRCPNLRPAAYRSVEMMCICYSDDPQESSPWPAGFTACGHYGKPFKAAAERRIARMYDKPSAGTADGQCTMLEEREGQRMDASHEEINRSAVRRIAAAPASAMDLLEALSWAEEAQDKEGAEACRTALKALRGRADCGAYTIAVDFDGTICENEYPRIGFPRAHIILYLRALRKEYGIKSILYTCRSGDLLLEAQEWCRQFGLAFDAVNENLPERITAFGGDTRKISADEYWDDRAVCP